MQLLLIIFTVMVGFHLIFPQVLWAIEEKKHRIITISTICLLDNLEIKVQNVLDMIEEAARRQPHDLVVTPLMPFLSFREGAETQDLKGFVDLAKLYQTYLAIALMEKAQDGQTFYTSILLSRDGDIAGKYRKTHALPDDTMALGNALPVFSKLTSASWDSASARIFTFRRFTR